VVPNRAHLQAGIIMVVQREPAPNHRRHHHHYYPTDSTPLRTIDLGLTPLMDAAALLRHLPVDLITALATTTDPTLIKLIKPIDPGPKVITDTVALLRLM